MALKVLLADHDATRTLALRTRLEALRHEVVCVVNGRTALQAWRADRAPIVILAPDLPDLAGIDVCRTLRGEGHGQDPFVFLLADERATPDVHALMAKGVNDILLMPLRPSVLETRLALASAHLTRTFKSQETTGTLEDLLASSRELLLTVSPAGKVLFANPAWALATGHKPASLGGRSVFELLSPESRRAFRGGLQRAARQRSPVTLETVFLDRRGVRVPVEGTLRPRMRAGVPASIRCQFLDVSKRKRAEAGLRATLDAMGDRTGQAYLRVLTRHLAEALGVAQGLVLEATDLGQERFYCVARWRNGAYREGGEVRLATIPSAPPRSNRVHPEPVPDSCHDALKWCFEAQDLLGVVLRTAKGQPLGVLAVLHDQRALWDGEARELLAVFARRAAAELGRVRAERELRSRERHAMVLADLQRSLLAWGGDWKRLESVMAKIGLAAGGERLGLFQAIEQKDGQAELALRTDWVRPDTRMNQPSRPPKHLRMERIFGAIGHTLRRGELVRLISGKLGRGIDRLLQRAGLPAAVIAPVMDGEELVGVLVVGYARASTVEGPAVWDLVASTANALSLAVQHSRAQMRLNSIVESIEEIVWSISAADGRRLYVNPAVERVFGISAESFYETRDVWGQAIHPLDADGVDAFLDELREVDTGEIEYRIVRPDGSIRWLRDRAHVHRDADGRAIRIDGVATDVTRVRESWQRTLVLSSLGEQLNRAGSPRDAASIIFAAANELIGCDAAWLDLGNPRDSETLRPVLYTEGRDDARREVTPETVSEVHQALAAEIAALGSGKVLAADEAGPDEPWATQSADTHSSILVPLRTGGEQIGVMAVRSYDGRTYGSNDLWTLQSLADYVGGALRRVSAEARWRDAELQAQAMVDAMPDPVFRVTRDGVCLDARGPSDLALRRAGDLIPRLRLSARLPADVADVWVRTIRAALEAADSRTFEYRLPDGEDTLYFEARVAPAGIDEVLVVVRDITVRVRAESGRLNMERAMQESQKLESLGVLAGGIAHDFNNLLTSIMGYASLARMKLPSSEPAAAHLLEVERATESAAELAMLMLAYSGRGQFVVEPFALEDVVRSTEGLLYAQLMTLRCVLSWDLSSELPAIEGDVAQIRQVVLNLVLNGAQAMAPDGGVVRVSAHTVMVGDIGWPGAYVGEDLTPGEYVSFEVTDTGRGMSAETLTRVFDPFFTTKEAGRGLGLSAVVGIVRGHSGALQVQSHIGRGTTFTILLPTCVAEVPEPGPVVAPQFERSNATILVVDDEPGVRALAEEALTAGGYRVLTAEGGPQALAYLDRDDIRIDLILLDMTMPAMSGVEVLESLRARGDRVLVLLSSGYSEADSISSMGEVRPDGFLQKPYRAYDLLRRLDSMLSARV